MSARTWHDGPPPHIGWWNASRACDPKIWRWWDGECWSLPAHENDHRAEAALWAADKDLDGLRLVRWTHYWPADARVPRVAP